MRTSSLLLLLCLVSFALCASALKQSHIVKRAARQVQGNNNGLPLENIKQQDVLTTSLGAYFIYYGALFGSGGADAAIPAAVQQYFTDITGTTYMNILSQYAGPTGNATTAINWVGQFLAGTPYGTAIGTANSLCSLKVLERILFNAANGITFDPTVQYYIVFGSDITLTNVNPCLDSGCGLHDQLQKLVNGVNQTFLVGWISNNAAGCQSATISGLTQPMPADIQNVLDTLAHEIAETITDPNQVPQTKRAWQDPEGFEISDKCQDSYAPILTTSSGASYNVLGNSGTPYLLQGQWSNEAGGCVTSRGVAASISAAAGTPSGTAASTPAGTPAGTPVGTPSGTAAAASGSAAAASGSAAASGASGSPSAFGPLPTNVCITCKSCLRYKKFKAVCQRKLGGTFSNPTGQLCCNGIVEFNQFSWSQATGSCAYSGKARKLDQLCTDVGGRIVCSIGIRGAIRKTCTH